MPVAFSGVSPLPPLGAEEIVVSQSREYRLSDDEKDHQSKIVSEEKFLNLANVE